jgi:hypothetical protein
VGLFLVYSALCYGDRDIAAGDGVLTWIQEAVRACESLFENTSMAHVG